MTVRPVRSEGTRADTVRFFLKLFGHIRTTIRIWESWKWRCVDLRARVTKCLERSWWLMTTNLSAALSANLFTFEEDFDVCGEAENGQEAIDKAKELQPDLIVMDLSICDERYTGSQCFEKLDAESAGDYIQRVQRCVFRERSSFHRSFGTRFKIPARLCVARSRQTFVRRNGRMIFTPSQSGKLRRSRLRTRSSVRHTRDVQEFGFDHP